ncbi:MAG: EamA family transporter [Candidatus Eremiobacteraeota bacterium]|nr:EamA family transporter [Candidatus Eremiobacteraeota bacterium]
MEYRSASRPSKSTTPTSSDHGARRQRPAARRPSSVSEQRIVARTESGRALPWLSLGVVYVVWGSTYLGIRVAVRTIPPYLMTGVRFLIAGALLLLIQRLVSKPTRAPSRGEVFHTAVTAALLIVIGNGLLCVAETRVESGTAALLLASTPIFMVLLDAARSRRLPSVPAMAGIVLGSIGIVALVGRRSGHIDPIFASVILVASLSWALGSIYARQNEHRSVTAALEMTIGGALSLVVGLLLGEASHFEARAITAASLWGMLWLITAGAMVGYTAYAYAVRSLPTTTVATYGYVNPVIAVILGATLLHENVTWNVLAGGAAIVAAVALILFGSRHAVGARSPLIE